MAKEKKDKEVKEEAGIKKYGETITHKFGEPIKPKFEDKGAR